MQTPGSTRGWASPTRDAGGAAKGKVAATSFLVGPAHGRTAPAVIRGRAGGGRNAFPSAVREFAGAGLGLHGLNQDGRRRVALLGVGQLAASSIALKARAPAGASGIASRSPLCVLQAT